ncbi:UDP-N-acetylglucosamine 2-epimerase [Paraburkholderia sp. 40]
MKVMVVMGTRPEVIKLAPLVRALRSEFDTIVCASGQHRDMAAQALEFFGIEPDITLETMHPGQSLNALASRLIAALDRALDETRPDWVIVQGDTTTAFCAGFAAFQRGIRVGHVEAGLRTGDLASPFPEEANRNLLGRIATLHFAPTSRARATACSAKASRQRRSS